MTIVTPELVGLSSARLRRIDAVMQRHVEEGRLAGAVTVLARRGQVAHVGCYGQMDIAARKPMREDAIFRLFSMTKPITSLAVMMLYEEGHFHLSAPIATFIPVFKDMQVFVKQTEAGPQLAPLERPLTIHDLLTHTSGLGYGLDALLPVDALYMQAKLLRPDESLAEKMPRIAQIPLHHQPGVRFTYSIAYDVLGHLVELVSGMALDAFFRQRIFAPLGMPDTDFAIPPEAQTRLATLYTSLPSGELVDITMLEESARPLFLTGAWIDKTERPRFLSGGGGLVSTAADYLRFALLLANKGTLDGVRLLSRKTVELMAAPHLRPEQFFIPGCSSGLGLTVLTDPARAQMLGSPGAYGGGGAANTDFWVDPTEELAGVLMTQYVAAAPHAVTMDFKVLSAQAIAD